MLLTFCTQYASKFGKLSSGQVLEKVICIPIPKKGSANECSNYCTTALISHASKVMLKIIQPRLYLYMNQELADVQAGFRKGRGTRVQIANIYWIVEKSGNPRKTSTSASLTTQKPLTVWITSHFGKLLERWEYNITLAS